MKLSQVTNLSLTVTDWTRDRRTFVVEASNIVVAAAGSRLHGRYSPVTLYSVLALSPAGSVPVTVPQCIHQAARHPLTSAVARAPANGTTRHTGTVHYCCNEDRVAEAPESQQLLSSQTDLQTAPQFPLLPQWSRMTAILPPPPPSR